jgi:hypothetical protein
MPKTKQLTPKAKIRTKKLTPKPDAATDHPHFHPPIYGSSPFPLFPWIEEHYLENMNTYAEQNKITTPYTSTKIINLNIGDIVYVPYDNSAIDKTNDNNEGEITTRGCYLGEITSYIGDKIRVHFTDTTTMTNIPKEQENPFEDVARHEQVYLINPQNKPNAKKSNETKKNEGPEQLDDKLNKILENTNKILEQTKNIQTTPQQLQQPQQPLNYQQHPPYPHPYLQAASHHPRPDPAQIPNQPKPLQDPSRQVMIRNIPTTKDENLSGIVTKIATIKNMTITTSDFTCLRAVSTAKTNSSKITPPNIIITFHNNEHKNTFKKRAETDITINNIIPDQTDNTNIIYIEENLPPATRELFWKTRTFKTKHKYEYAWTKNGSIYLKKNTDTRAQRIESTEQLQELEKYETKEINNDNNSNNNDTNSTSSSISSSSTSSSSSK